MLPVATPNIYAHASVQRYLEVWFTWNAEGQPTQLARWLGEAIGYTAEQVFNLLKGARVQPDTVPALARALGLDTEGREHLRRMVALQHATDEERKERLLSVWESHAAHEGIPASEMAQMHARDDLPMSDEGALLPVLALLRAHGLPLDPREVAPLLVAPIEPSRLKRATELASNGPILGRQVAPRLIRQAAPGRPGSLSAAAWHGLLDRSRETLLRTRPSDRGYGLLFWSADAEAERAATEAIVALEAALVAIAKRWSLAPIRRIIALQVEQVRLTDWMDRPEDDCGLQAADLALTAGAPLSRVQEGSLNTRTSSDGRPCIYASLQFHDFAQGWIAWRRSLRRPCSVTTLARAMEVGKTLANDLSTGRVRPRPGHVAGLVRAYGLTAEEAHYLEGIARYEQATDPEDKGRERQALLRYAVTQGVRTIDGERWRVAAHWGPRAIWALSFLPDFWAHPVWISLALHGRLPIADCRDMLTSLLNVGLLVPQPTGPPKPATSVIDELHPSQALSESDQDLADFALQDSVLRLMAQELALPAPNQQFYVWIFAGPDEARDEIQAALRAYGSAVHDATSEAQARAAAGGVTTTVMISASQLYSVTNLLSPALTRARR